MTNAPHELVVAQLYGQWQDAIATRRTLQEELGFEWRNVDGKEIASPPEGLLPATAEMLLSVDDEVALAKRMYEDALDSRPLQP